MIRPVQCPKCREWVLLGLAEGFKAAVDVLPATPETYRETLMAGRSTYVLVGPSRQTLRLISGPSAAHADWPDRRNEHACGNRAFSDFPVKAPEAAQKRPVCDLRRQGGWNPPPTCPRRSYGLGSVAAPTSCDQCEPPPFDNDLQRAEQLLITMLGATRV